MDLTFDVLNEQYTFTNIDSFTVSQLPSGDWQVMVDGTEEYQGEFAPTNVAGSD